MVQQEKLTLEKLTAIAALRLKRFPSLTKEREKTTI